MDARQQQNTDIDRLHDVFLRVSAIATIGVFLGYPLTVIAIGNAIYKSPLVTSTLTWFLFCFPVYVIGIVCLPYFWRGGFLYLSRRFELSATAALDILPEPIAASNPTPEPKPVPPIQAETPISVTRLYREGRLMIGGGDVTANHYNNVLTHARKNWLMRGANNEKLAYPSDLKAAGYEIPST